MLINNSFHSWKKTERDSGTVVFNNDVFTLKKTSDTGAATLRYVLPLVAGMKVVIKFNGKNTGGGAGRIGIESPDAGVLVNHQPILSNDWINYTTTFTAPLVSNRTEGIIQIFIGLSGADKAGEVSVSDIEIYTSNTVSAPLGAVCVVHQEKGKQPVIHGEYIEHGIESITYSTEGQHYIIKTGMTRKNNEVRKGICIAQLLGIELGGYEIRPSAVNGDGTIYMRILDDQGRHVYLSSITESSFMFSVLLVGM
ncbi:hypothetical protein LH673_02585 [Morganella morganii]|uniref:hypothetical protein n=1 Tax=Morganella morganii TaxID=582 RepID=UPI001F289C24|nr:hypothetical protein [Morganella morganii]MCF1264283.1 hypothetical protein [Morganella morganii]